MAAGVPQDRMRIGPLQGMVDQTGVGMEKEDPGQMMSTGFQVRFLKISAKKWRILTSWVASPMEFQQENFTVQLLES